MRRKRTSPQEQLRLIQACRQSGWTDFDWCQEHGIPPATFYGWIHRLKQKGEMEIPAGDFENGWVKFTYNGQTAYSSADYLMQVDGDLSGLHVTCRTLNVRAGAGTNFDILGTLSRGTEISVRDVLPGWYEIDFLGGIGYVSSAYIG